MFTASRVLWAAVIGLYDEVLLWLRANLLWCLFNIPFGIAPFLLFLIAVPAGEGEYASGLPTQLMMTGLTLLLVPSPASMGMHRLAATWQRKDSPPFRQYLQGVRDNLGLGFMLYTIGVFGILILVVNVLFYVQSDNIVLTIIGLIFAYVLLFWLCLQTYLGPLVELLGERGLVALYRRAALLTIGNPIFSFTFVMTAALLMALSLIVPLLFLGLTMAYFSLVATRALGTLKQKYDPDPVEDER